MDIYICVFVQKHVNGAVEGWSLVQKFLEPGYTLDIQLHSDRIMSRFEKLRD